MGLIPLGILSSAGAGGAVGDYELIESYILGSAQSSVVFSSLATYASTYKHLQVRVTARGERAFPDDFLGLTFNGDGATNYSRHGLWGNGSIVQSYGIANTAYAPIPDNPAGNAGANIFGASVIDILDAYSTSKNKTVRALGGATSSPNQIQLSSGAWRSTASVTSLTLTMIQGNIVAGSRFSLYGIR